MTGAYYNEYEPYAADWLRNLIKRGLIADGEVDSRSIVDVRPEDLKQFTQCHFFAGIGVWSYALRLAGWDDSRPVWTGSCPCQPFSSAGKKEGFDDERHLWPHFHRVIAECRPPVVFGEQVASKDGLGWLDAVFTDLEASGYAAGAADICAAGIGAPHIRQRLWFVGERLADAPPGGRREQRDEMVEGGSRHADGSSGTDGGLGDHHHQGLEGQRRGHQAEGGWEGAVRPASEAGKLGGLEHASSVGRERGQTPAPGHDDDGSAPGGAEGQHGAGLASSHRLHQDGARPTNGHWRAADWLYCRDGKWRPVEPGTFPLVDGAPARVGRLRAYGNAIVPQVAAQVIGAYMDTRAEEF